MDISPLKLLYIGGWGRSGSTLIGGRLGAQPGWVHVGEIWHLWQDSGDLSALCSCRKPYRDCTFWGPVLDAAGITPEVAMEMRAIKADYLGTRQLLTKRAAWQGDLPEPLQRYGSQLLKLYRAIADATGARCLVDASKTPSTIRLLSALAQDPEARLEPKVLHLIRDPRAVAYSWWFRPKARGPQAAQGTMARHSPLRSTLSWRARNKAVVAACTGLDVPRFELRYEDFALDPENTLKALIDFVGPVSGGTAPHAEIHSIRGNAVRFDGPAKPIKLDEKWRSELPGYWQRVVEMTAGAGLRRYGYRRG